MGSVCHCSAHVQRAGEVQSNIRRDRRQLPAWDQGGGADSGIGVRKGTEDSMKSVFGTP